MFFSISKKENQLIKGNPSSLVLVIGLSNRTAVLFCNDFTYYYYSLSDMKCIYESKLEGTVYKGAATSPHEIVVSII